MAIKDDLADAGPFPIVKILGIKSPGTLESVTQNRKNFSSDYTCFSVIKLLN